MLLLLLVEVDLSLLHAYEILLDDPLDAGLPAVALCDSLCVQDDLGLLLGRESLSAEPNGCWTMLLLVVTFAATFEQLFLLDDLVGGHVDLDVVQSKLLLATGEHLGRRHGLRGLGTVLLEDMFD